MVANKISNNGLPISHLFFADDCLLFTHAKASQANIIRDVLQEFCKASGLKVNIHKSCFMSSKNVTHIKVAKVASIVNFKHTVNLGKYLGFPMWTGRVKNSDFFFLMDKINNRVAGWKGKLLSRAGRVTLAKSIIVAIPTYTMQNLWLPDGICDSIDATVRNFVWGRKTCHWVNWNSMTQHRSRGA